MKQLPWMIIAWPSFLAACALEMLVFALVDPSDLHASALLRHWSGVAIYSSAFFLFWAIAFISSMLTAWLSQGAGEGTET
jgi:hypothetical protein